MAFRANVCNFSKGEIAPELYARTDVQAYSAALKLARNVKIKKYGGVTKRPGTRLVARVYENNLNHPVRLVPFTFNDEQTYVLEMGQGYMRPIALGGNVLEGALAITGITNAGTATVSCAYHGYVIGDQVYFVDIAGMVEINGLVGTVLTVPDENSFTVDIDTAAFSTFTGSTGGTANTAPPDAPATPPTVPAPVAAPVPPDITLAAAAAAAAAGIARQYTF